MALPVADLVGAGDACPDFPAGPAGAPAAAKALHRERLERMLALLASAFEDAGVAGLHVKGFAVEARYPAGVRRQFKDIEVFVAGMEGAQAVFPALRGLGFGCERLLIRNTPDGEAHGLLVLRWRSGTQAPLKLELLIGEHPLTFNAARAVAPFPERPGMHLADAEESMLFLVGEMSERRVPRLRDLVDYRALREALPADLGRLRERIRRAGLWRAYEMLRDGRRQADAGSPRIARLDGGRNGQALRRAVRASVRPGLAQALADGRLPGELRRLPATLLRNLLMDDALARALPAANRLLERWNDPGALVAAGHYVGCVCLDPKPCDRLAWLEGGNGKAHVLLTPFGAFLPALSPVLPRERFLAALSAYRSYLHQEA